MGSSQGPARTRRASLMAWMLVAIFAFSACGNTGNSTGGGGGNGGKVPDPPTATPKRTTTPITPAPSIDALTALRNRASFLVAGQLQPQPFLLDWDAIKAGSTLPKKENDAFCQALEFPKVDDALASLAALVLNAVSEKFRHKPLLNEDAEEYLKLAAGFAVKSCRLWSPQIVPMIVGSSPAPTPPPGIYQPLLSNPLVTWTWSKPGTFSCTHKTCWQLEVKAPLGCPTQLRVVLVYRDPDHTVLGRIASASTKPIEVLKTTKVSFWSDNVKSLRRRDRLDHVPLEGHRLGVRPGSRRRDGVPSNDEVTLATSVDGRPDVPGATIRGWHQPPGLLGARSRSSTSARSCSLARSGGRRSSSFGSLRLKSGRRGRPRSVSRSEPPSSSPWPGGRRCERLAVARRPSSSWVPCSRPCRSP